MTWRRTPSAEYSLVRRDVCDQVRALRSSCSARPQWPRGLRTLLTRARTGDREAFRQLVEPYRHHLQLHCYRILGSVHDAGDALQETLLSAWQGLGGFEERASVRTWLYRVATNCCLKVQRSRRQRGADRVEEHRRLKCPEHVSGRVGEVFRGREGELDRAGLDVGADELEPQGLGGTRQWRASFHRVPE